MCRDNYDERHSHEISTKKVTTYGTETVIDSDSSSISDDSQFSAEGRKPETGTVNTVGNLLRSYMSAGALGLPYAFKQGGVCASIVLMLCVSIVSTHSMLLLVKCKNAMKTDGVVSYSDVGDNAYGKWMRRAIDTMLVLTQFGFCVVYMVYVSSNIVELLPSSLSDVSHIQVYVLCCCMPIFIAMSLLKSLKNIGSVSTAANIAFISGITIIFAMSGVQINEDVVQGQAMDVEWFVNYSSLALAFGMSVYAFEGIGVVIPAETGYKHPARFSRVLLCCMIGATVLYITLGLVPYLAFGVNVEDEVINNFKDFVDVKDSSVWHGFYIFTRVALLFMVWTSYPIQMFVVNDIVEDKCFKPGRLSLKYLWLKRVLIRVSISAFAFLLAATVNQFGMLMSLIGSFSSSALQFIFPGMIYLKLFKGPDLTATRVCCFIYITFGIIGGGFGTVQSIIQISDNF
eukprot:Nk52_evm1s2014 gene=Nk52_evmTU1s2014